MTSISKTQDVLALVRGQATRRRDGSMVAKSATPSDDGAALTLSVGQHVNARLSQLSPDDPHRKRRAVHFFLEGVLLNLVGQEAANESMTQQLVEQVERTMAQDEKLATAINQLAERLLAGIDTGRTVKELCAIYSRA